jgi:hypothetical protein
VWLSFLLKFFNLQRPQTETFSFASFVVEKKKNACHVAISEFFLQHPEICVVYVACPGDDADKFLLPLHRPKHFFGKLLVKKLDTTIFWMKKF